MFEDGCLGRRGGSAGLRWRRRRFLAGRSAPASRGGDPPRPVRRGDPLATRRFGTVALGNARARWTYSSLQVIRPRGSVRRTRRPDEPSVGHRSRGRGNPDALVFTASCGGPLHLTNFRSRVWVTARQRSVRAAIWPAPALPRGSQSRSGRSCGRQGVSVGTRATAGSRAAWTTPCPPRDQCGATGDLIVPLRTPRRP